VTVAVIRADIAPLPGVPASLLGESPVWHPDDSALWWCDIPGRRLNRWHEASGEHRHWDFDCEPACIAPLAGGEWLLAMRDGLWRFEPASGRRTQLAAPPYDPAHERFNDGRADALGRFWVGTLYEPRDRAAAALYRFDARGLERMAGDVTVSNGLAFSADGRTMIWADTKAHSVMAFDLDLAEGSLSGRRELHRFTPREADAPLERYGGRPDGAAMDAEGCLWLAMFEGQRLVRLAADGTLLAELPLPVRCPTMPCFGGADLRTLYMTTARERRPAGEIAAQPWAGCVLRLRVDVPGLPVNFARM
jgi:sugar lactone lactonase YvrE